MFKFTRVTVCYDYDLTLENPPTWDEKIHEKSDWAVFTYGAGEEGVGPVELVAHPQVGNLNLILGKNYI